DVEPLRDEARHHRAPVHEAEHHLHGKGEQEAKRKPFDGRADLGWEEFERNRVSREDEEQSEPEVVDRERALPEKTERADGGHGEEGDEPGAGDGERHERPRQRIAAELIGTQPCEGDHRHGQGHQRAQRQGRNVLRGVGEKGMDGSQQPHGDLTLADLEDHVPDHPRAGEQPDDQGREEVGAELLLPHPAERLLAGDARPDEEHDERRVGGEDPDEEFGAVGHRGGEADPEHGRDGGKDPHSPSSWRRAKSSESTSSSGGSSTTRSVTGSWPSAHDTSPRSRPPWTWSWIRASSCATTDAPNLAHSPGGRGPSRRKVTRLSGRSWRTRFSRLPS